MTKKLFITQLFIVSLFSFLFVAVTTVHAAEFNLGIYPPLLKVNIKPGKTITQVFRIDNYSNSNKIIVARLVPFQDADLFGNPQIDPQKQPKWLSYFSLANSAIKLGQPFEIKANSSEQLILSLDVPSIAPMGDIYGTLLISTYQTGAADKNLIGSSVLGSIGSNLLITINSQENPTTILSVKSILPEKRLSLKIGNFYFIDNITPIKFEVIAQNNGDYLSETKGIFKIEKNSGQPVHLYSIMPQYVISHTERQLQSEEGAYFQYTPSITDMGVYKAKVEINSPNGNASDFIEIILFPFKAIIGLGLILIILTVVSKIAYKPSN